VGEPAPTGLTPTGHRLVVVITALSIAHHVDHAWRDVTGWPLGEEFNAFSASLFVYPVIVAGLALSARRQVGARFWAVLAGVAALFVLGVHVGPAAADSVGTIPEQYGSTAAGVAALAVLGLLLVALVVHCAHEIRRLASSATPSPGGDPVG
jgi:glucose dehydrogenase